MCLVWDMCTINFTNNTNSPMTLSSGTTSEGKWDTQPPASIAKSGGTGKSVGASSCGDAVNGTAGDIVYSLNDGTLVNVHFYTSYYYGIGDNSVYTIGFQGAKAAAYTSKTNSVSTTSSNGSAGKRTTWTLSVDLAP